MDSDADDVLERLRHRLARMAALDAAIETERIQFDAEVTALTTQPGSKWTTRGVARCLGFASDNAIRRARERAAARADNPATSLAHAAPGRSTRDQEQH